MIHLHMLWQAGFASHIFWQVSRQDPGIKYGGREERSFTHVPFAGWPVGWPELHMQRKGGDGGLAGRGSLTAAAPRAGGRSIWGSKSMKGAEDRPMAAAMSGGSRSSGSSHAIVNVPHSS